MQVRQGDVLIEAVPEINENTRPTEERLLVRGEGRYHGHFVEGEVRIHENPHFGPENLVTHYLEVSDTAVIEHRHTETGRPTREHDPIPLPAGRYRVLRQREYNPYARVIQILQD